MQYLLLKSQKCAFAFAVKKWHVYTKDTQKAVGLVLQAASLPACSPGNSHSHRRLERVVSASEYSVVDSRDVR
jgi:hypothetical protein